jgi:hypothetical protein
MCLAVLPILAAASEVPERVNAVSKLLRVPAGITLPVQIGQTLRAGKTKPGTVFTAATTQRVPVSGDSYIDRGAKIRGEVVASAAGDGTAAHPSVLTIKFTQLSYREQTIPVVTQAVAVASIMSVSDTYLQVGASADFGNPNPASWTTQQVGGDFVARSGWVGDVVGSGMRTVGHADFNGVYSLPVMVDGMMLPRAMGVFSTTAKGLYGYEAGAVLESSGGLITVTSPEKHVVIRSGENLLLEVSSAKTEAGPPPSAKDGKFKNLCPKETALPLLSLPYDCTSLRRKQSGE